jgi:hypothetical protein
MLEPLGEMQFREANVRSRPLKDVLREEEDALLLARGFQPAEGDLWRKDGMWFGREAALQRVSNIGKNT